MVMKIWTSQIPEPFPSFELIELGVFTKECDTSRISHAKSLVEVKKNTDIPEEIDGIEGFFIPIGCLNLELLEQLQQTCLKILQVFRFTLPNHTRSPAQNS